MIAVTKQKVKKFKPIVSVGDRKYYIKEINLDRLFLDDGRKLHWEHFFKSQKDFRNFLKKFEKYKCNKQVNFLNSLQSNLKKYSTTINVTTDEDGDCAVQFDIDGDITEIKAGKPITSQRILDILHLRGQLDV